MRRVGRSVAGPVVVLLLVACAGDPTGDNGNGNGGGTPTLSADIQPIFTSSCALSGCHAGISPQQGMNLSAGISHANTVGVASNQSPLLRIMAGNPDSSYLVHKIQGTQGTVGGAGSSRMPRGRSPLSQADIDRIRAWITAGALNN